MVLVASSPFFSNILKNNKHPHPLIYMRGVRSEDLMAIMDFMYQGEANVNQECLEAFLLLAEELQLKGLRAKKTEEKVSEEPTSRQIQQTSPKSRSKPKTNSLKKDVKFENESAHAVGEKTLALVNSPSKNYTDIDDLDQQVKSMMAFSENSYDKDGGRLNMCKVCGREGRFVEIIQHIEANHIVGISIPCDRCGKVFKSRNTLRSHISKQHRKKQDE